MDGLFKFKSISINIYLSILIELKLICIREVTR